VRGFVSHKLSTPKVLNNDRTPLPAAHVLLSLIGGGLALCVLGAAVYDIGRAFSLW
jgi:hypothetical protein